MVGDSTMTRDLPDAAATALPTESAARRVAFFRAPFAAVLRAAGAAPLPSFDAAALRVAVGRFVVAFFLVAFLAGLRSWPSLTDGAARSEG